MPLIAHALREDYAGTVTQRVDGEDVEVPVFTGGLIAAGDNDLDVRAELDDGDGVIVTSDSDAARVAALDRYPALKRVPVPEDRKPANPYLDRTVTELRAEAHRRGLTVEAGARKDDLAGALLEHDERIAAGDHDAQPGDDRDVTVTAGGGLDTPADHGGDPDPDPQEA